MSKRTISNSEAVAGLMGPELRHLRDEMNNSPKRFDKDGNTMYLWKINDDESGFEKEILYSEPQPQTPSGTYTVIMKIHGVPMSRESFTDKDLAYAEAERLRTKFLYDNSAAAETRANDIHSDPEDFVEIEVITNEI